MPKHIERRNTAVGPRYREWSSIVDVYLTHELTREEMLEYLTNEGFVRSDNLAALEAIHARLLRTDERGTSIYGDSLDMESPWRTECCNLCGRFHHEFKARPRGHEAEGCQDCGEPLDCSAHKPHRLS